MRAGCHCYGVAVRADILVVATLTFSTDFLVVPELRVSHSPVGMSHSPQIRFIVCVILENTVREAKSYQQPPIP